YDLPETCRYFEQLNQALDNIVNMTEASRLRSVAMNLDRFISKSSSNKTRNNHAVLSRLTRADGIEEPDNDDRKARFLPVPQRAIARRSSSVLAHASAQLCLSVAPVNRSSSSLNGTETPFP